MSILESLGELGPVIDHKTGEQKAFKDFPFRYIGLYFTATWCSYCHKIVDKMPSLVAAINSKGSFFRLLTFRLDDDNSNFAYSDLRFKWMNQEKANEMAGWLGVHHIPMILIYDYLGRLVSKNGYAEMTRYREETIEMWDKKMKLL